MQVPSWLLSAALWSALAVVACAVVFLLVALVVEWRAGRLW